jgi:hypothetical protein
MPPLIWVTAVIPTLPHRIMVMVMVTVKAHPTATTHHSSSIQVRLPESPLFTITSFTLGPLSMGTLMAVEGLDIEPLLGKAVSTKMILLFPQKILHLRLPGNKPGPFPFLLQ